MKAHSTSDREGSATHSSPLPIFKRHLARWHMNRMGMLWSLGNALLSGTLILNLCSTLGMLKGSIASLVFLMPWLTGILRTFVPVVFRHLQSPRRFCTWAYAIQAVFLIGIIVAAHVDFSRCFPSVGNSVDSSASSAPTPSEGSSSSAAAPSVSTTSPTSTPPAALAPAAVSRPVLIQTCVILLCWFLANLCESCAFLILTTWQGEIFPARTRGRFFGRLSCWRLGGELIPIAIILLLSLLHGLPSWKTDPEKYRLMVTTNLTLGVFFCLSSLFFLRRVPECPLNVAAEPKTSRWLQLCQRVQALCEPFTDSRFIPLLCYGAYFSLVTQLEQATQFLFLYTVLAGSLTVLMPQVFRAVIKLGQWGLSRRTGQWIDRYGAAPVMLIAQLFVALGPLFYVLAANGCGWGWLFGAQVLWIAYVGLNIGLPQIQLQLAKPHESASWLAAYGLVCAVFACVGLLVGGVIYDRWHEVPGFYSVLFSASCAARLGSTVFLVWLILRWKHWRQSSDQPRHDPLKPNRKKCG